MILRSAAPWAAPLAALSTLLLLAACADPRGQTATPAVAPAGVAGVFTPNDSMPPILGSFLRIRPNTPEGENLLQQVRDVTVGLYRDGNSATIGLVMVRQPDTAALPDGIADPQVTANVQALMQLDRKDTDIRLLSAFEVTSEPLKLKLDCFDSVQQSKTQRDAISQKVTCVSVLERRVVSMAMIMRTLPEVDARAGRQALTSRTVATFAALRDAIRRDARIGISSQPATPDPAPALPQAGPISRT